MIKHKNIVIKQVKKEQQVVVAEVYQPNAIDSQGDFMTADEICKMAYQFMCNGITDQVDVNHDNNLYGCYVVESFIAREDDSIFIPGAWVVGIFVPDPALWNAIKTGQLDGFSMEAEVLRKKDVEMEIDCPVALKGHCELSSDGRTHEFIVAINENGEFTGGRTSADPVDGHFHEIKKGGRTEMADGHYHKYSTAEEMIRLENEAQD